MTSRVALRMRHRIYETEYLAKMLSGDAGWTRKARVLWGRDLEAPENHYDAAHPFGTVCSAGKVGASDRSCVIHQRV